VEYETLTAHGHRLTGTLDELLRLAVALLHAASDMAQTRAACDMLENETEDMHRARALETAIAVCYARAFTKSTLRTLPGFFAPPKGTEQRKLHNILLALRDKVYAHTDLESGRSIRELTITIENEIAHVKHFESWHPLDRELLNPIRELCHEQEARLRLESVRLNEAIKREAQSSPPDQ
jgi:hypothetical protein